MTTALLEPDAEWRDWPVPAKARLRWRLETDLHSTDPRANQLPPEGDWLYWVIMAGRGWGKTRTGAETLAQWIEDAGGYDWAVVAPTIRDVRETCFEGSSGLLNALTAERITNYNRSLSEIECANGARIYGLSAEEPDRLHGKNLAGAWCDELALWRYDDAWTAGLIPALRIGNRPRVVVTTTPRPTPLLIDLTSRDDGTVHVTRGRTWENRRGLSATALAELERRYKGTRLGQQELEGELLTDTPGALWTLDDIARVTETDADGAYVFPDLERLVIALDPAVTSGEDADDSGIIAAGRAGDRVYVLEDLTCHDDPDTTMRRVIDAFHDLSADRVVIEQNHGFDYLPAVLRAIDDTVPVEMVNASRGKALRAEPVASLYRQGRVFHVGVHERLEAQMTRWTPDARWSPDRLDALVWAVTALVPELAKGPGRKLSMRGA